MKRGLPYVSPYLLKRLTNWALTLSFCVIASLLAAFGGTGISTCFPSTTPFGLALGPDLPWADEPSPGILRFSAKRILTSFIVYLYQHSLFHIVHLRFHVSFSLYGSLLYQWHLYVIPRLRCIVWAPLHFRRKTPGPVSYYALFIMMAASKPTSWLSLRFHILFHLTITWGP